jgi:thioredoxin reductase
MVLLYYNMETLKINRNKEDKNNIIDDKRGEDNNLGNYEDIFDVAIIGGGFAGLSAALLLGRYLRPIIIFDVFKPRPSYIHGYLGYEKSPRNELIQKAWHDVIQYPSVKRIENRVERVEKDVDNDLFLITSTKENNIQNQDNSKDRKAKAKYLIIATGIQHIKPNIKNFEEYDGNGVWHCPHCDGFETTDKKLVIIASDNKENKALDYAKVFLGWTKDITLFLQRSNDNNDIYQLSDKQRTEAKTLGIDIIENDDIIEIVGDPNTKSIQGIITRTNGFYKADVLFYHLKKIIQNEIAIQLGCELDEGYLKVNERQQTTISNVYAAGDIDTDRHYAIMAAASGALAAISIYEELLKDAIKITKIQNQPE